MFVKVLLLLSVFLTPLISKEPTPSPVAPVTLAHPTEVQAAPEVVLPLPIKTQDVSYEHAFIKMILTLGGLLLLVFFTLWILRKFSHGRMGGFGSQKKIKILEKRPLSPKTVLYLLELDGKEVFIAESQLEIKTLLKTYEMDSELD